MIETVKGTPARKEHLADSKLAKDRLVQSIAFDTHSNIPMKILFSMNRQVKTGS